MANSIWPSRHGPALEGTVQSARGAGPGSKWAEAIFTRPCLASDMLNSGPPHRYQRYHCRTPADDYHCQPPPEISLRSNRCSNKCLFQYVPLHHFTHKKSHSFRYALFLYLCQTASKSDCAKRNERLLKKMPGGG